MYSLELMHRTKHEGDKNLWYVAGVFFCKTFEIKDVMFFVDRFQPRIWFQTTFEKIKKLH
jgi:hypothetical protein